jgi:hypothetical protein
MKKVRATSISELRSRAGSVTSPRKKRTSRANGKQGGRPGNPAIKRIMRQRGVTRQRAWVIWKEQQD